MLKVFVIHIRYKTTVSNFRPLTMQETDTEEPKVKDKEIKLFGKSSYKQPGNIFSQDTNSNDNNRNFIFKYLQETVKQRTLQTVMSIYV